jgi:RNA exonuclease NGL2
VLLERSRVVHVSVDPTVPLTNPAAAANEDEDGGAQADPDRVITNARQASPADGLLSSSELVDLFAVPTLRPRSLYDEGQRLLESISGPVRRCGERLGLPPHKRGAYEPEWTSYTHYWQNVLGEHLAELGSNIAEQFSQITFGLSILPTKELLLCACFNHT